MLSLADLTVIYDNFYNNSPLNKYTISIVLLILLFVFCRFLIVVAKMILKGIAAKTRTMLDDNMIAATEGPMSSMLFVISLKIALIPLKLSGMLGFYIDEILRSIILVIVGIILIKAVGVIILHGSENWARRTNSKIDPTLVSVGNSASKITITILLIITLLALWGVNVTSLLAGLGIAGIAIGLALKDSLANIFGGISIILDRAVRVDDRIEVSGVDGTVTDIGLRSTKIKTADNELVIIPNGVLVNAIIKNHILPDRSAVVGIEFGVEYGSDHEKVRKIVIESIKSIEGVLPTHEPIVNFASLGDSSINFKLSFWIEDIDKKAKMKDRALSAIYDSFRKAKIGIPYPTRTVYLKRR